MDKEFWTRVLVRPMYRNQIIQTIRNTPDPKRRAEGWILKNGLWSPWFLNLRLIGNYPDLFNKVCSAMADMMNGHRNIDILVGVEMAGVPIVGGLSTTMFNSGNPMRFGYTRPLPEKVRTVEAALSLLNTISGEVASYGQKSLVEIVLQNGDNVAILDDMATSLESKLIARELLLWEARQKKVEVRCESAFYLLNRNEAIMAVAGKISLEIDYVVEFNHGLRHLEGEMSHSEFGIISAYQEDPGQFQDKAVQEEVITDLTS